MTTYAAFTLGASLTVTKPKEILKYVLRYYATSLKSVANVGIRQSISLLDTVSRYGARKEAITGPIQNELTEELLRYFPQDLIEVDVTTAAVDSVRYTVVIGIVVTIQGIPYSIDRTVTINNGILVLDNDTVTPTYGNF